MENIEKFYVVTFDYSGVGWGCAIARTEEEAKSKSLLDSMSYAKEFYGQKAGKWACDHIAECLVSLVVSEETYADVELGEGGDFNFISRSRAKYPLKEMGMEHARKVFSNEKGEEDLLLAALIISICITEKPYFLMYLLSTD